MLRASSRGRLGALLVALIGLAPSLAGAQAAELDSVALRLKWRHQFQFAGYYAAREKGFYREAGLEVTILEGQPKGSPIDEVLSNRAQFGVETSGLLVQRVRGRPLVALAALFQQSPAALIALETSGIRSPRDLIGRRLMMDSTGESLPEIAAMLQRAGVQVDQLEIAPHTWNIDDLIEGRVDAATAYATVEPFELERRGIEYTLISPFDHGVDFYGDCLFTSEHQVSEHPERVKAFLEASIRGWVYALDHPDEIIALIEQRYGTRASRAQMAHEAEVMRTLMFPKLVEIGHMNPDRWRQMADTFVELGLIPADYSLEGFLYDPDAGRGLILIGWLTTAIGAALLIIGVLASFNARLKAAVDSRTAELEAEIAERSRAEADLRRAQKLEAVGTLAGGVAHDFNNLLTGILGGVELALLDIPQDSLEVRSSLRQSQEAAQRAAELTERLLSLSRRNEPELGALEVNDVIERSVRLFRSSLPTSIEIEMKLDPDVPRIRGHDGQVGQALLNLVINARDAMPDGGRLVIESALVERQDVSPPAEAGCFVRVSASDTGVGIDAEARDHLFEPFFTTKTHGRGTGLGLAMIYSCMQSHHGWVEVDSKPGEGARFDLFFPRIEVEAPSKSTAVTAEPPRGSETVLLVDDMDSVLFLGRGMLERCGYRVLVAWNGEEALERFEARVGDVDLVITDLVMPRSGGRDLLLGLRERGHAVPVVLTTGYGMTSRAEALEEGFADLILKPFDMGKLGRAARDAIDAASAGTRPRQNDDPHA